MPTKVTNLLSLRLCYFFIRPSQVITDTILQGQLLRDSELLFSADGYFQLGFFCLGDLKNSYLRIFYNIPDLDSHGRLYRRRKVDWHSEKAVWVANRNTPISDKPGILMIHEYGMKISQSGGNPIILNSFEGLINASATLLDNGNFILSELKSDGSTKQVLWQSFDYPTDALLPGMKLRINFKTGHTWSLTSWISNDVPAPGSFKLGGNPNGTTTNQLFILWQRKICWTSGFWLNG